MGIELPTPQNEARIAPQPGTERPRESYGAEQATPRQSAEIPTTERPSFQEAKTGQGVGDGFTAAQVNDVTNTTQASAQPVAITAPESLDDIPVVAADEDLIEKQWVESAKRIIHDAQGDPYKQGEAIGRLQADYLQKRYGKTLADSEA